MSMMRQVAALPIRHLEGGDLEMLIVTSRDTGRWVIPKGWPIAGKEDSAAAATEAFQEAGVTGIVSSKPIGSYRYFKRMADGAHLVDVSVYLLAVTKEKKRWREQSQRRRVWLPLLNAARQVREPGLRALIAELQRASGQPKREKRRKRDWAQA